MAGEVWLIRHGETEWSKSGAHTGRTDLPLTPEGRSRAEAIGRYLAGRHFDLVLASPLSRARDTCVIAGYGSVAVIDPDAREWDYGDFEGRKTADIRKEWPDWTIWDGGAPNGEPIAAVADRARRILARADRTNGDVAVFSHGHFLRIFTACWLQLGPRDGRLFALSTASVSVLGYERETRVIERWNYVP